MPAKLVIQHDINKMRKQFEKHQDAVNHGLTNSLRATVFSCRKQVQEYARKQFDTPTQQTIKAFQVKFPNFNDVKYNTKNIEASVWLYQWAADYLLLYEEGTTITEMYNKGNILYPVNMPIDAFGNVKDLRQLKQYGRTRKAALEENSDFFIIDERRGHLASGIYYRDGEDHLIMIYGFDNERKIQKKFDYADFIHACYKKEFPKRFKDETYKYFNEVVRPNL